MSSSSSSSSSSGVKRGSSAMGQWHQITPRDYHNLNYPNSPPTVAPPRHHHYTYLADLAITTVFSYLPLQAVLCNAGQVCKHWHTYSHKRLSFIDTLWSTKFIGDEVPLLYASVAETEARLTLHWRSLAPLMTSLFVFLDPSIQRYIRLHNNPNPCELTTLQAVMLSDPMLFSNLRRIAIADTTNSHDARRNNMPLFRSSVAAFERVKEVTIVTRNERPARPWDEPVFVHDSPLNNELSFACSFLTGLFIHDNMSMLASGRIDQFRIHARSLTELAVRAGWKLATSIDWFALAGAMPLLTSFRFIEGARTDGLLLSLLVGLPVLRHFEYQSARYTINYRFPPLLVKLEGEWFAELMETCLSTTPGATFAAMEILELSSVVLRLDDGVMRMVAAIVVLFPRVHHITFGRRSDDCAAAIDTLFAGIPTLRSLSFVFNSTRMHAPIYDEPRMQWRQSANVGPVVDINPALIALRPSITQQQGELCVVVMTPITLVDEYQQLTDVVRYSPFRYGPIHSSDFHRDCRHLAHLFRQVMSISHTIETELVSTMGIAPEDGWSKSILFSPALMICHAARMPHCMQPNKRGPIIALPSSSSAAAAAAVVETTVTSLDVDDVIDNNNNDDEEML